MNRLAMVLVLSLVACGPGYNTKNMELVASHQRWAEQYGCQIDHAGEGVMQATLARSEHGPRYKPEVGWDACELMFALGLPSKEESQDTETAHYKSWWYQEYDSVHLISLEYRPDPEGTPKREDQRSVSPWKVVYVGW